MNKLKEYREKFNYTQYKVAEELNITQQQYSRLENGISVLNANQLIKLSKMYNCTPNDLLNVRDIYLEAMSKLDK